MRYMARSSARPPGIFPIMRNRNRTVLWARSMFMANRMGLISLRYIMGGAVDFGRKVKKKASKLLKNILPGSGIRCVSFRIFFGVLFQPSAFGGDVEAVVYRVAKLSARRSPGDGTGRCLTDTTPRATVRSTGRSSGRTGPLHWPCPGRNNRRYEGWRAMRPAAVAGRDRARVPRRRGRIANRFRGAPAHRLPRRAKC